MIHFDAVSKQHGSQILFVNASAAVFRGQKVGLVGPNGAGKSTLFRLLMKEETSDEGTVSVEGGLTLGYFNQDVGEMSGRSVVSETMAGAGEISTVAAELAKLEAGLSDPAQADNLDRLLERFGEVQARFDELGGYGLEARAREILAGLGFSQEMMDGDVGKLSGGWKMRVALSRILLMRPDALLLDEPSNHLDLESLIWLETFLKDYEGALLMTSHDREFLNRIVTRIIEIDGGVLTSYTGNYDFYEQQRALNAAHAEAAFTRQQAMLAKEKRFIDRFKAQAAKAAQVQSRIKKLDKIEELQPPVRRRTQTFDFPQIDRSGDDVVRIEGVGKQYGSRVVHANLSLTVKRGDRWAIMGVNGAGKSTLLKMIAQETGPDTGKVTIGASVSMGYFAQHAMELLDAEKTVYGTLEEAFPLASVATLRTLAGCFGFSGDDIEKNCRVLSGGEKARLVMARLLYGRPNFLVLDEPTNHLDMTTKEMLVKALSVFQGTMIFVSHDRSFLAGLSNRVLELNPDGAIPYGGGYLEYVARSGHEAPGLRAE
ncbi:MAG: ABC-F family ATP-binding cassette domain-containing protein [Deltaproteobacteria bacterium]|nr:ABC-F family ATP-binding cassette domain-containing protein [Deltaproteobacteria bacterium]